MPSTSMEFNRGYRDQQETLKTFVDVVKGNHRDEVTKLNGPVQGQKERRLLSVFIESSSSANSTPFRSSHLPPPYSPSFHGQH